MNNLQSLFFNIISILVIIFFGYVLWNILKSSIVAFQKASNLPKYIAISFMFLGIFSMWINPFLTIILILIIIITLTTLTKIYRYKTAKLKQQLTKAPKRPTFPTIPGMKNPLQEDLERAEEEKKEHQRLQSLESIKGTPLHDLIKQIDNPMRETNKKIMREAVMMAEKQIHHSAQSPIHPHKGA